MSEPGSKAGHGAWPSNATRHGHHGPWLVLIHGWCGHQGFWDEVVPRLTARARVVTLDLPGHGASGSGPAPSIPHMARDLAAALDGLGIPDPVLVGHSMGGPVAIETAILIAPRCRMVIGIDTFTDAAFYARSLAHEIAERTRPFATDFAGAMTAMVRRITFGGGITLADEIARAMAGVDQVTALAALEALLAWDIAARWPALPCPVETINAARLARTAGPALDLPGLRVHLMEGVGHFPMREDPTALATIILDIVRRHVSPASGGG